MQKLFPQRFSHCCASAGPYRGYIGARGKKQVWQSRVRTWGLSGANVLYWREGLRHCWDFSAPPSDSASGSLWPLMVTKSQCGSWITLSLGAP